jgi:hypothetical protein
MIIALPKPIAEIFRQVERLERAYPGRKFTPDGHLIGSIGEVIAAEAFGLDLLPASAPGHDARDESGALVQIKLTGGKNIGLRASCERLLVMRIYEHFKAQVREHGVAVSSGSFGAEMQVDLANDGPVTIWLDTARR